jgi:hypothetical protein
MQPGSGGQGSNQEGGIDREGTMKQDKAMNIELSTKEYNELLDMLHIADVVMSGHRKEKDMRTERHRALIQKVYALAHSEGLDRLIRYNERANVFVPTAEFEQNSVAHAAINEFEDHIFWDELISQLTVRDAARIAGGMDRLNALSDSDRQAVEGPIRQRYIEEFSANGAANLSVIQQFVMNAGTPVRTSD